MGRVVSRFKRRIFQVWISFSSKIKDVRTKFLHDWIIGVTNTQRERKSSRLEYLTLQNHSLPNRAILPFPSSFISVQKVKKIGIIFDPGERFWFPPGLVYSIGFLAVCPNMLGRALAKFSESDPKVGQKHVSEPDFWPVFNGSTPGFSPIG